MTTDSQIDPLKKKILQLENQIKNNEKVLDRFHQEQLFSEKVLDSLPGIFYLYDENGTLIRWNKTHETITGYTAEELPHMGIFDWFSASDKDRVGNTVDHILKQGEWHDIEADLIIKNGKAIPCYFTGVRMSINGKKYLLGMGTDLTKIKRTERLLKKSEEKYRAIVENAVEGIYQSTPEGRMVSANASMARILGYDSSEDLMDSIHDVSEDLYVSKDVRRQFIKLMRQKKNVAGLEVAFYKKGKRIIWVSLYARPVFSSKGGLILIEGMILDITEEKARREELQRSEAMLREENLRLKSNIKDRYKFGNIIGKSPAMQEVYELILKASATDTNVIVYGESGTGKELVARAIHDFSDRKGGRFVPVNCSAIPENLLESEFFGYKKGAFTGAASDKQGFLDIAHGGTLFLDELGEITMALQAKLLRAIEGGGYTPVGGKDIKKPDIRIIAATNRDLQQLISEGMMREDFFYRIHIIPINLPPLRNRIEDIPLLIDYFLKQMVKGGQTPLLSGEMVETMFKHTWPGNVRELQNVLQRYVSMGHFDMLNRPKVKATSIKEDKIQFIEGSSYSDYMDIYERKLLINILEQCQWNREQAATRLKIPIRTFYRKLKKHCLKRQNMPNLS